MAVKKNPRTEAAKVEVKDTFVESSDTRRMERRTTSIRLHPAVLYQAKEYALRHDTTVGDVMQAALLSVVGKTLDEAIKDDPRY